VMDIVSNQLVDGRVSDSTGARRLSRAQPAAAASRYARLSVAFGHVRTFEGPERRPALRLASYGANQHGPLRLRPSATEKEKWLCVTD
jgi:hypothetical protein